jgi:hypothetical protein
MMNKISHLEQSIIEHLSSNPEDFARVSAAVNYGLVAALERSKLRQGDYYNGMLAALTLMQTKRVTPELQGMLLPQIKKAIGSQAYTGIEREFLDMNDDI